MTKNKIISVLNTLTHVCESMPNDFFKISSALILGNEIVSIGQSKRKTHPLQKKYGRNTASIYLHAEIDCIRLVRGDIDFTKTTLVVCRLKYYGNLDQKYLGWGFSRPCSGCSRMILDYQIPRVIYTIDSKDQVQFIQETYKRG